MRRSFIIVDVAAPPAMDWLVLDWLAQQGRGRHRQQKCNSEPQPQGWRVDLVL